MKRLLVALLLVIAVAGPALAGTIAGQDRPVVTLARTWLEAIDAGRYAQSWRDASAMFRGAVSEAQWAKSLRAVRKPLGAVRSRTATTAVRRTSLPGAPDGHYMVMTFATSFADKRAATETVTFVKEADGVWRAAGYSIK